MADSLSPEKRSWNMSRIKNKDTSIEIKVRRFLYSKGFRYRINVKNLPGKPDIVLRKYKTVIFINGCFWHRHENCKDATTPKSRTDFWLEKFNKNVENDKKHTNMLISDGWNVIILWQCEIEKNFEATMSRLLLELTRD
ncbi:MAG: DNA mismatch endonuclease Vsr [Hungatella sp.]|nr:DNA mismatch endonuclease Vsr [Hungatella sp.]